MIPLRDDNPAQTAPTVTRMLIVANVLAFFYELSLGRHLGSFIMGWGLVPQRLTLALSGEESPIAAGLTIFTSMFLHGGWIHLLGNMWYLWIFGDNVEDAMGHAGFLGFYLVGGVASALLHTFFNAGSPVPTVGASGAIACVLGAYLVLYPRARVVTLVPIVFFFQIVPLPAMLVLGLWFVIQFFSGTLAIGAHAAGGVAWWAHVGGFAFGMVVAAVVRRRPRSRAWVDD